jgi:hypothetical protein
MPLRSTLLNQGKFEEESCIAQPNIFAMLCGEAPCEAVPNTQSRKESLFLRSLDINKKEAQAKITAMLSTGEKKQQVFT